MQAGASENAGCGIGLRRQRGKPSQAAGKGDAGSGVDKQGVPLRKRRHARLILSYLSSPTVLWLFRTVVHFLGAPLEVVKIELL